MNAALFVSLVGLVCLGAGGSGQDVLRNPAQPPAANAGRVVSPQKVWRIKDAGDGYFLTNPGELRFGADGTLFVQDVNKILRFDADGRFLRAYKPRSASGSFMFHGLDLTNDAVVTFERVGQRVYIFDLATGAERGFRLPGDGRPTNEFLFCRNNRLYFAGSQRILSYTMDGKPDGPEISLATDQASEEEGPALRTLTASVRAATLGATEAMLCTSFDYRVRRVDLAAGRITRAFARDYKSVRNENASTSGLAPNKLDVGGLQVVGDQLWVFTSTSDQVKGTLVDVFDRDGRYLDSFFLQVKDGEALVPLSFGPKTMSGRDLVIVRRSGAEVSIEKYTLPAGV